MSSVTANIINNCSFEVLISQGGTSHGSPPTIVKPTVPGKSTANDAFVANSDGAGVEGYVYAKGNGVQWALHYDNPVIGSNSGGVDVPNGYTGSCQVGSGDDATFTYTIGQG